MEEDYANGWNSAKVSLPALGEKVLLLKNGVLQNEVFYRDEYDKSDYNTVSYWSRDDLDTCPEIAPEDWWIRLSDIPLPAGA